MSDSKPINIGNWVDDHDCLFTHQVDRKQFKTFQDGKLVMAKSNALNTARRGGEELVLTDCKGQRSLATFTVTEDFKTRWD